ncbi:MAG TPA: DUF4105 domain-containing protein [Chiayiivirga sp.]|nr:DUF4105 domain-containing protein [Chiayiivirga sp.]
MTPARWLAGLLSWLMLVIASSAAHAQALPDTATPDASAPRIGVVTMTPGRDYWARFGHDAIVVSDPLSGQQLSYNYGYFDFDQPGFFTRFLRGKMLYRLVVMPLDQDLASYAAEGRGAELQWLNLTPTQARAVARFLNWNALPENADYHYDYFTANCSTKVRDVLDHGLDGALKRQLSGRSHGLTYRSEALRLGAGVAPMYLGMHAALGPFADRPLSLWDEAFVPRRLADALAEVSTTDGKPLVEGHVSLLPDRLGLERDHSPRWRWGSVALGVLLAALLAILLRRKAGCAARACGVILVGTLWLVCGLGGVLLLGLWLFSAHVAAWGNENVLLFNPLCLLLLPALPALARGAPIKPFLRHIGAFVLACTFFALFLRFLPFRIQDNGDFIALWLPIHAVVTWRLLRRKP